MLIHKDEICQKSCWTLRERVSLKQTETPTIKISFQLSPVLSVFGQFFSRVHL